MKRLLVIAKQSGLAAAVQAALPGDIYQVLAQEEVWEAEVILGEGIVEACLLDAELTDIQPIRIIKHIRRLAPRCPILIYTANKQWEWEEEAYLLGVAHILAKPVRGPLLQTLLDRVLHSQDSVVLSPLVDAPKPMPIPAVHSRGSDRALKILRDFSEILTHSLCSESLLRQFLLLIREILGVNRAAIFLRRPLVPAGISGGTSGYSSNDLLLRPACALGIAPELLPHLTLSLEHGIGRFVYRSGRILKNGSDESRGDLEAQKEFALLGAQVAIPILDRESLVGVAVFDGRLTGEFFANEELALIFHLLEGVGLAIKNSWLHDQLAGGHEMLTDILSQLQSGCIVVDRNLQLLHANPAARTFLRSGANPSADLRFTDLPELLASKIFETLQTGVSHGPFQFQPDSADATIYQIRITAFATRNSAGTNAVLLLMDDITDQQRAHELRVEAEGLRLMKSMAAQLAHEIGNSMVPILTYQEFQQKKSSNDPALRSALSQVAGEGIRRISRLNRQMQMLATDALGILSEIPVAELIEQATSQALAHAQKTPANIQVEQSATDATICADADKLAHALSEIVLNALQASPPECPVQIRWLNQNDEHGNPRLCIEFQDNGAGFTAKAVEQALEPFFSTRTVGIGLGLTLANKVIQLHHGRIEIRPAGSEPANVVRVHLPLSPRTDNSESSAGSKPCTGPSKRNPGSCE